jgi:myo-inositol-1(or 4)-monophosphatase
MDKKAFPEVVSLLKEVVALILHELPAIEVRRYDVTWKADGSPVTAADIYLEDKISALLKSRLPNLTFIGEESWTAGQDVPDGWTAVLDPIDGTENFCSGLKEWGTSLSIWHGAEHAGSLLMMPELGEALSSGEIRLIPRSRIVGFSSSYHPEIGQGLEENPEGRIMGCAVYNLFNVVRGAYARFINPKGAMAWDLLAGVALAHEVGCTVLVNGKPYQGQFLTPDQRYKVDITHHHNQQRSFPQHKQADADIS